jgi:hypothetical protein
MMRHVLHALVGLANFSSLKWIHGYAYSAYSKLVSTDT